MLSVMLMLREPVTYAGALMVFRRGDRTERASCGGPSTGLLSTELLDEDLDSVVVDHRKLAYLISKTALRVFEV